MRATRPPRASASASADAGVRAYRAAEATPTATAPAIAALAQAALALLARAGARVDGGPNPGDSTWRLETETTDGAAVVLSCSGPDLPASVPARTAHPTEIPRDRQWVGTHRLVVAMPLIVLDLYWRADAPLRIMGFSRGDWEAALLRLAR